MARAHVKKSDIVTVITGADRGRSGKVLQVIPKKQRVLVEGVNIRKKTMRRSQDNPQGAIVEREFPIHISNVMLQAAYDERRNRSAAAPGGSAPVTQDEVKDND